MDNDRNATSCNIGAIRGDKSRTTGRNYGNRLVRKSEMKDDWQMWSEIHNLFALVAVESGLNCLGNRQQEPLRYKDNAII